MSTNADFFRDALRLIGVLGENDSVSAEQGADMLVYFNDLLEELRNDGIELGVEPQSSTTATLSVPEGYKRKVKYLLAIQAAPNFNAPIPQSVAMGADDAYKDMLRDAMYKDMETRDFDHLPYQSGQRSRILTG